MYWMRLFYGRQIYRLVVTQFFALYKWQFLEPSFRNTTIIGVLFFDFTGDFKPSVKCPILLVFSIYSIIYIYIYIYIYQITCWRCRKLWHTVRMKANRYTICRRYSLPGCRSKKKWVGSGNSWKWPSAPLFSGIYFFNSFQFPTSEKQRGSFNEVRMREYMTKSHPNDVNGVSHASHYYSLLNPSALAIIVPHKTRKVKFNTFRVRGEIMKETFGPSLKRQYFI